MNIKFVFKSVAAVFLIALSLTMTACDDNPYFVRVVSIEGVPETGTAGTPLTLTAAVRPGFAKNNAIEWLVMDAGTAGARISGNILHTDADGIVIVKAKVINGVAEGKDYTQDFKVVFSGGVPKIEPITSAAITVTGPAKNDIPDTAANSADGGHYIIGSVSWSPDDNPFRGETVYTAKLILTADQNYKFPDTFTVTINGNNAEVNANTGTTVTISYTFVKTLARVITGLIIKSQPAKLTYTEGEALNLSGLVVTLSFDTGSPEDVAYSNFSAYNISAEPAHGTALAMAHNGRPVVVSAGNHRVNTNLLTVNKASDPDPEGAAFNITLAQIIDAAPAIGGPTLSRLGTGYPKATTLSIGGTGYDSISWEITGTGISGTEASFKLDAADARYNQIGDHHLTLIVYSGGVPYSKIIIFTIVN